MSDEEKENREDRRKHLEFIQSNIARMHKASFQLKSMTITIATALIAAFVALNGKNINLLLVGIVPVCIFWGLDAYYLWEERKFCDLYADVASGKINEYQMPINNYRKGINEYLKCVSKSVSQILYPTLIVILVLGFFLLRNTSFTSQHFCYHRFF